MKPTDWLWLPCALAMTLLWLALGLDKEQQEKNDVAL